MPHVSTRKPLLYAAFSAHPASVGETYLEHSVRAAGFGLRLVVAGLACFVHAVFPAACPRRASDTVLALHAELSERRGEGEPAA